MTSSVYYTTVSILHEKIIIGIFTVFESEMIFSGKATTAMLLTSACIQLLLLLLCWMQRPVIYSIR
jgi:hypothetical protein